MQHARECNVLHFRVDYMYTNGYIRKMNIMKLFINEPIPECAKHHGSLVTQQNFSTWRLYFSNEGRC
jgi:hypothetical protein